MLKISPLTKNDNFHTIFFLILKEQVWSITQQKIWKAHFNLVASLHRHQTDASFTIVMSWHCIYTKMKHMYGCKELWCQTHAYDNFHKHSTSKTLTEHSYVDMIICLESHHPVVCTPLDRSAFRWSWSSAFCFLHLLFRHHSVSPTSISSAQQSIKKSTSTVLVRISSALLIAT